MFKLKGSTQLILNSTKNVKAAVNHHNRVTTTALRWAHSDSEYLQNSKIPTMHFQKSLPRLAIPKLEDTMTRYMESQKPLLNQDEFAKTQKIADDFMKGDGKALHDELVAMDKQNKHTSYISGPWFDMYLKYRDSIVLNHNPFILTADDPHTTDQLTRATKLIHAALRFKKSLEAGNLEPDVYHLNPKKSDTDRFRTLCRMTPSALSWYTAYLQKAFPLDMSQYGRLFNSTRVPAPEKDILKTNKDGRHILVIRNGNIFTFDAIKADGSFLTRDEIHTNLNSIIEQSHTKADHPLAVLTSEHRDTWAAARSHLISNPNNAELLDKIDSAIFGIFLDDRVCNDENDATEMFLYGEGDSRWFDKSFHMALSSNARMAINFEHAWGDGVAVVRFLNEVCETSAKDTYTPAQSSDGAMSAQKLNFDLDESTKTSIKTAMDTFKDRTSKVGINAVRIEGFGKSFLKTKKMSPDAMMQLSFQLAHYRQHGKHAATYESCSTAAFKHGRTETMRPCTTATAAVCEAFEKGNNANVETMVGLLQETSNVHGELTKNAAMGQGFDRHLFAMRYISQQTGQSVPFFQDPAYANINHIILSTSTVFSPNIQMGGFAPVVPDGLGVGYMVNDDWVGCNASSYPGSPNAGEFVELVHQSILDIKAVLEGRNFKS
ncbi:carnitine O-palmitoyltransferase 2, mitochondrial-like [Clytia hemisphaerica]|uniref:Choline/carnitine acyltransferase domain-containing protein n=1 Tax=Clytia hemisphaerica TaxID=252671 RepID=A0A7M5V645_9CNID|eukprot:TCONS_00011269-protein